MKIENIFFNSKYCLLLQNLNRKSLFAALHLDINSPKSGLLYLTGQLKSRTAKVKDGTNSIVGNYLIVQYSW
jgi:hypothetical protein